MDAPQVETIDWQQVRARVARLEEAHGRMRSRGLLALRVNVLIVVAIACWLAWAGKSLTAESVSAGRVGAGTYWSARSSLDDERLRVSARRDESWIVVGYASDPHVPELRLTRYPYSQIDAMILGSPFVRLSGRSGGLGTNRRGPTIEMRFAADWSPQIVLRDVFGETVWQAP